MRDFRHGLLVTGAAALVAGCSNSTALTSPTGAGCSAASTTQLAAGTHIVIDASASGGCVRLPAAGASGARHLLMAFSATAQVTDQGLAAPFLLSGTGAALAAATARLKGPSVSIHLSAAQRFHNMLRTRGRELAAQGFRRPVAQRPNLAVAPPPVGSARSFQVCSSIDCTSFSTVTASLQHVGPHGLLYLDNASPANGYTSADISRLGTLFDSFMYPIDTTAFGRESDIDNNGAVVIVLSPAVNQVSANCNKTGSVVLGFFFPGD